MFRKTFSFLAMIMLMFTLMLPTQNISFAEGNTDQGVAQVKSSKPESTGTVVIAKPDASHKIKVVGTSTITVMNGTRAGQLKAQIMAKDHSKQTYTVLDQKNNKEKSGTVIQNGDKLLVTAEDGQHQFTYHLAIYDPNEKAKDGKYWNEALYNEIDKTVNANTPVFKNVYYNITDPKYAHLIRKVQEKF